MAGSGTAHLRPTADVLLQASDLHARFPAGRGRQVHAVSGVSFDLAQGETLGIVGESGCGKSSTARAVLQLPPPSAGSVTLAGQELTRLRGEPLRRVRRRLQVVLQDPVSSLNPRRSVRQIVAEGMRIWHRRVDHDRVHALLDAVGIDRAAADRRPHEFSGGQCQRISIARALALDPDVLICDEPVSALDVSVQAQILSLLAELKRRYRLTMLFVAHDLAVVRHVSDHVLVLYLGKVCELAPSRLVFATPAHPYTRALLASVPGGRQRPVPREEALRGEPPSPVDPPSGCRFRTRCPRADDQCAAVEPAMRQIGDRHWIACHHPHPVPHPGPAGTNGAQP